jgi:hypothetical protein
MTEQKPSIGFSNYILLLVIYKFINGYVLFKMYYWFIEPAFNLSHLSIFNAIGIMMLTELFHGYKASGFKGGNLDLMLNILANLLAPFIILGLGYLVHLCM